MIPTASPRTSGSGFAVRVDGHLDDQHAGRLGQWRLEHHPDGTTSLTAASADQAQLHGLLTGLRDLGIALLAVARVDAPPASTLSRSLRTARLTLRPAHPEDADATWAYRRLPEVGEWLTEIPADQPAYRATFTRPERLATTVVVECDGSVIGDFMLRIEDAWAQAEAPQDRRARQAELGWVLDPAATGRGYATEAVRALIAECFTTLGVRRVTANCFLANEASWRLMERVGMRREQHAVRESLHRCGQWLDTVTYAILAEEGES